MAKFAGHRQLLVTKFIADIGSCKPFLARRSGIFEFRSTQSAISARTKDEAFQYD
jgi:hypothetical protein